jgi:hypothetical protein
MVALQARTDQPLDIHTSIGDSMTETMAMDATTIRQAEGMGTVFRRLPKR